MTNKHHNNFWTSILTPLMDRRGNSTDANNNLTTLSDGKDNLRTADSVAGKQDLQMTYSYAADKQITAETIAEDVLADTSFTASYDAGNRITNWNRAGAPVNNAQSWNYDDNGNWISTTKDGVTEARNHDNTDQLTQIAGKASTNDAKGNLTAYEQNGKEYEIDYDLDNRIIKVDIDNNDVEYRYDALGRRVIRQEGSTKTALIWWGNSECAEHKHQAGQTVIQNDIMAHPSRLNSVIARAVDGSKFKLEWYHKNYLDHVYAVSDDDGDILEHYRYSAFGQVTIYNASGNQVATTQIDNHILWNTRRRDEVTGYYLYKYRHYSAELGRWPSRDPIGERGGVNLYGFVGNGPIDRWDKLGLSTETCEDVKTLEAGFIEPRISEWLGIEVELAFRGKIEKCSTCCGNNLKEYIKISGSASLSAAFNERPLIIGGVMMGLETRFGDFGLMWTGGVSGSASVFYQSDSCDGEKMSVSASVSGTITGSISGSVSQSGAKLSLGLRGELGVSARARAGFFRASWGKSWSASGSLDVKIPF